MRSLPGAALLLLALTAPALADKANDTLRVAVQDPISTVDNYLDPKPETGLSTNAIFDTLIVYDMASASFKPDLAESWTRVDDRTLEFKLRRDVTFHDGSPFSADDVVYTLDYIRDPAAHLRFAADNEWIEKVEKIDPYTVRITAKKPTPFDLARLAISIPIYPALVHGKLADKSEFGRHAIGTGPYKLESVDPNKGVMLVRNERFQLASPWRPAAAIARVNVMQIPDYQTAIAQLVTGGVDMIRNIPLDEASQLGADPRLEITASTSLTFFYMAIDSAGRSGHPALGKQEVRKGLMMAVDRPSLAQNIAGGGASAQVIDALCVSLQTGCAVSVKPPGFDPQAAKALLAGAGYPDGFDVEITDYPGAQKIAEAVAGQLRAIGVRASVDHRTFAGYREKQRDGKIQILVGIWDSAGLPDVSATMDFFFAGPRDYWQDDTIKQWAAAAGSEMDADKRRALYRQIFDRINERNYILPLTSKPTLFANSRDVMVAVPTIGAVGTELNRDRWR